MERVLESVCVTTVSVTPLLSCFTNSVCVAACVDSCWAAGPNSWRLTLPGWGDEKRSTADGPGGDWRGSTTEQTQTCFGKFRQTMFPKHHKRTPISCLVCCMDFLGQNAKKQEGALKHICDIILLFKRSNIFQE